VIRQHGITLTTIKNRCVVITPPVKYILKTMTLPMDVSGISATVMREHGRSSNFDKKKSVNINKQDASFMYM
jgi:hypothetical protein